MTNLVDTSEETINAEFDAAEKEIGTDPDPESEQPIPEVDPVEEAQKEAEIAMATGIISTSLTFAIGTFSGVSIDSSITQKAAEAYAVCIIKYYPGGIFALLDRYKEEMAVLTSTIFLVRAVSEAKAKKAEEEEKAQDTKKPNEEEASTDGNA